MNENDNEVIVYTSQYDVFTNSTCMFVEYHDIIKAPMFFLLFAIQDNEILNKAFDLSEIKICGTVQEMLEWYINRKSRNIFECFPLLLDKDSIPDGFFTDSLNNYLEMTDEIFAGHELAIVPTIAKLAVHNTIVKNIIIYNEVYNKNIEEDIANIFPESVKFVWGDFKEILPQINKDTTFIFSDMNKLNIMAEMNLLNYRSVILAQNFKYNINKDGTYKANIEDLMSKFEFNLAYLQVF